MSSLLGSRFASRWVAGAGLVVIVAVTVLTGRQLQAGVERRSDQQLVASVESILTLTVRHAVQDEDAGVDGLSPAEAEHLNEDVKALQAAGNLIGLAVWRPDGTLLWADSSHLAREVRLPAGELQRAQREGQFTQRVAGDASNASTMEVFSAYDVDGVADAELIVEVILPEAHASAAVNRYTHRLYAALGLVALLLTGFGLMLRRRLIRREYEALHDSLTGLGNRLALADAGTRLRPTPTTETCLILLDLDGFKEVNDTLGHHAGDEVLVQIATVLADLVRTGDLVVRLGGDEFAILMPDMPDDAAAMKAAWKVLDALGDRQWSADGVAVNVGASAGIAMYPSHADSIAALLQRADVAMYQAKRARAGVVMYDPSTDPHDIRQLNMLAELRAGIASDELVLHYQPKVDLLSGEVRAVEALVRWQHPQRGLLAPGLFLPSAEHTALMAPLTRWVLNRACAQAADWFASGRPLGVAVNISPRLLLDGDLPQLVLEMLAKYRLPSDLLELEITETAVMTDPERARLVLERLASIGVRVSMDDFGAGYTSMALLRDLPVHTLKIDQGFITHMLNNDRDEALAETVIELGHRLKMQVIAEGVETEQVGDRLRALGCDQAQGFYFAHPMPVESLNTWLADRPAIVQVPADEPLVRVVPQPRWVRAGLR